RLTSQLRYDRVIEKYWKRGIIVVKIRKMVDKQTKSPSESSSSFSEFISNNHHPDIETKPYERTYLANAAKKQTRRAKFWVKYKSLILSALTASVIGSGLGLVMLNIFADLDPEEIANNPSPTNNQTVLTANHQTENQDNTVSFQSSSLNQYVIQAGVYSTETKAQEIIDQLSSENIQAMIWPREDKYHVFVAVHPSAESSKKYATESMGKDFEWYAGKSWPIPSRTIELKQNEIEWLASFESYCQEASNQENKKQVFQQW